MLTIRKFAALCRCSTDKLRYYDRIGLLKPAMTDSMNNYRYYSSRQLADYARIRDLQAAGFSIKEIKKLLAGSEDEIAKAFDAKISQQNQKLEKLIVIRDELKKEGQG